MKTLTLYTHQGSLIPKKLDWLVRALALVAIGCFGMVNRQVFVKEYSETLFFCFKACQDVSSK